jgi:hypothetical protein
MSCVLAIGCDPLKLAKQFFTGKINTEADPECSTVSIPGATLIHDGENKVVVGIDPTDPPSPDDIAALIDGVGFLSKTTMVSVFGNNDRPGWNSWFVDLFGMFPNLGLVSSGGDTGPSESALVAAGLSDIATAGFMCADATRRGPGGVPESGATGIAASYRLIPLKTSDFDFRDYTILLAMLGINI